MRLLLNGVRKLSWIHSFAFVAAMFALGAVPVFVTFLATNGVTASTIIVVVLTALIMLALARFVAAAGAALQRRLLARFDKPRP
jgi:hypothetical protein